MKDLPADVLDYVVEYVASEKDLCVLCRCSRALNEIATPRLYQSLKLSVLKCILSQT